MYVVTCTAADGVYIISEKGTSEVLATVRGSRELAEAMALGAAIQKRSPELVANVEAAIAAEHSNEARAQAAFEAIMEKSA